MSSEIHLVLTHISELLLSYSHVVHSSGTTQAGKILKKRTTILENHQTNSSGKELIVIYNILVEDKDLSQVTFVLSNNSEFSQIYQTKTNDHQPHQRQLEILVKYQVRKKRRVNFIK